MKNRISKLIKIILISNMLFISVCTITCAAWWGTPGYEWAKQNGLTSLASNSSLNNKVSQENFYSTLIKYLKLKNVTPKNSVMQNTNGDSNFNKALNGIVSEINTYLNKQSLTPQEFRIVSTYAEHVRKTVKEQANLLKRDDLKGIDLYLSLVKYTAAVKIDEDSYKTYVLKNMGAVKYKELVTYNIRPYIGDISRKEFLVLMYSLLSDKNLSETNIIKQFYESGVLEGYAEDVEDFRLSKPLTYAEMFTFLRRFEAFDFETGNALEEELEIETTL